MANEVMIDQLAIEVSASVEPAAKSIGDLASAVKKYNSAIAGSKGFGDLVTLANASKTAADNMQDAPNKLRELADALKEIANSAKGMKIPAEFSKSLSALGESTKAISANIGQRMKGLASGLAALRDVGDVRISNTIGNGINDINGALANLNVNNLSRIERFTEAVRRLEALRDIRISRTIGEGISAINIAAGSIDEGRLDLLRRFGEALSGLANVNEIRFNRRLADDIVNLGVAAQTVQDVDWSVFERMAEGLRHLEGLGQIRIPRIRPTQARVEQRQQEGTPTGNATETENRDGIAWINDAAERTALNIQRLRGTFQTTEDVRAFVRANSDVDILAMRLAAARDRLQDLLNAENGELNLQAIANATEQVQQLERELANAQNGIGRLMGQFASGFAGGAGISGILQQMQQIFSSPAHAIGFGLGFAIQFAVRQAMNFANVLKSIGIKAFTASVNALKTALSAMGSAAMAAGKGLAAMGKMAAKGLAGLAKLEFKGLMALPTLFSNGVRDKIAGVAKTISGFVRSLGRIAFYRMIRSAIKEVTKAFSEGVGNLYQWSLLVDHTFAKSMDKIAKSMLYLKNSLGAMVAPILNTLAPVIDFIVDKIVDGINLVNQFLAAITGSKTYTAAKKVATEWAENETEKANKSLKELKKTILGFDELNILNKDTRTDEQKNGKNVPDYKSMFETRNVESSISEFARKIRDAFQSGEWTKLGSMFADKLNGWIDGIDWPGLGKKLGDGLNHFVQVYNGFMDNLDWFGLGDNLAEGINSFMDSVDWYELGRAFTQHIDALFGILAGFVEKFDWKKAGEALADAVYGMFDGIDWDRVGTAIGDALTGIGDVLVSFAKNFEWEDVGSKLASGANKMFDSVDWTVIADGINGVFRGALNSLNTFIDKFSWKKHGETLKDGLIELVTGFPTTEIASSLTGVMWGILEAAMPTLNDTELMRSLGYKIADFFNGLFNPEKDFWGTAGTAANALLIDLLTIGQSFVDGFDEIQAANSIKDALDKIRWDEIATKAWGLIRTALGKAGSFADALFTDKSNMKWDMDENVFVSDNSKSLGTRIADSLKKTLGSVPWEQIASDTWKWLKNALATGYDFISAMFGLDKDSASDFSKKTTEIGRKIGAALRDIPWATIAKTVWSDIKTAFSHAGNFIDALLGDGTRVEYDSMLRMNRLVKDTRSFGEKLGARVSEAFASINWNNFGTDIGKGARALFKAITDFFNKLRDDGEVRTAITNFFAGIKVRETVDAAIEALGSFFTFFADAFRDALKDALKNAIFGGDLITNGYKGYSIESLGGGKINTYGAGRYSGAKTSSNSSLLSIFNSDEGLEAAKQVGKQFGDSYVSGVKETLQPKNENGGGLFGAIKSVWQALTGANAEENTYGSIPGMVKGDSGGDIQSLMSKMNEVVTNGWATIQETFKKGIGDALYGMYTTLDVAVNTTLPNKMAALNTAFSTGWTVIQTSVKQAYGDMFYGLYSTMDVASGTSVPNKMQMLLTAFDAGWNNIVASVKQAYGNMYFGLYSTMDTGNNTSVPSKLSTLNTVFSTGWNTIGATVKQICGNMYYSIYATMDSASNVSVPSKMNALASVFQSGFYSINSSAVQAMSSMTSSISSAISSIENTLPGRFRNMCNSIIGMANGMIGGVENAANSVISGLNNALRIHLTFQKPDWAGGGTYWWDYSPNLSHVSFNRVSQLAAGGILDRPTMLAANVIAGEAGREAVLPLEQHTEWMDEVADRVNERAYGANGSGYGAEYGGYDDGADMDAVLQYMARIVDSLREIERKDANVEITTGQYEKAQRRSNRRAGKMVIAVGT